MEMLDKVAEYTQSKSEAAEIIDNESERWHHKTDVDKTLTMRRITGPVPELLTDQDIIVTECLNICQT